MSNKKNEKAAVHFVNIPAPVKEAFERGLNAETDEERSAAVDDFVNGLLNLHK